MINIATAFVLAVVSAAHAVAGSVGGSGPTLRFVERHPLVVRGVGFHPSERVTVRAPNVVRVVRTSATGVFRADLGVLPADRCSVGIVARGALGDRAQLKVRAMCPPAAAP